MSRVTSHEPNLVTYYIPFKVSAVKTASNKRTVLSEQVRSRSKVLNWFHGSLHRSKSCDSARSVPLKVSPSPKPWSHGNAALGSRSWDMSNVRVPVTAESETDSILVSRSSTFPIPRIILSFSQKSLVDINFPTYRSYTILNLINLHVCMYVVTLQNLFGVSFGFWRWFIF